MSGNSNIGIKLELCKDKFTNNLSIVAHFDPNAPNFYNENGKVFWVPTTDEVTFLKEAADLLDTWKQKQPNEPSMNRVSPPPQQPEKQPFQPGPPGNFRQGPPNANQMETQTVSQAGPNTSSIDSTFEKHMERDRYQADDNEQKVQRIIEKKVS